MKYLVKIRGPFNEQQINELKQCGVIIIHKTKYYIFIEVNSEQLNFISHLNFVQKEIGRLFLWE